MAHSLLWTDQAAFKDALSARGFGEGSQRPDLTQGGGNPRKRVRIFEQAKETHPPSYTPIPSAAPTEPARAPERSLPPSAVEPPIVQPGEPLETRINRLLQWVMQLAEAEVGFLSDSEGLPLAQKGASDLQIVSALMLDRALASLKQIFAEPAESLSIRFSPTATWHFFWIQTEIGRVGLGVLANRTLNSPDLQAIQSLGERLLNGRSSA